VRGANGSGKSTLLRLVAGISRPSGGAISGRPSTVGFAPERLPSRLRLTAREYVRYMCQLRHLDPARSTKRAVELFEVLDLLPSPDAPISTLSKGNSQKVALIQAIVAPVGLLVLDEPLSGLDGRARLALSTLVADRQATGAAVVASAQAWADRLPSDRTYDLAGGVLRAAPPEPVAGEALVRVELTATLDGRRPDWLEGLPISEVRISSEGRSIALLIGRAATDILLGRALAAGWSVESVTGVVRQGDGTQDA
jgi:ABC-type multidrug transport system ATPase subunit